MRSKLIICFILVLMAGSGCLRNPVTNRREAKLISEPAERRIGEETRVRLIEEYGELKEPVLAEYVSALGKKIAVVSDRPRLDYVFTVLDTDMVNAFAAPGGFIFVTRGLLEEVESEAELASVLGHEIGHVCAWHSINMIEKQMGYGTLAALGAIVSGFQLGPEAMVMVAQTADLFTNLYLMGYSREYELEADRVGTRYMLSAGYDPEAALMFFARLKKLEKQEGLDKWESFFRSHPHTEDRVEQVRRYMERMNVSQRPLTEGQTLYQEMKGRLPRIPSEEKGRFAGSKFAHPGLGIQLEIPSTWKWDPKNQRSLAAFRESDGESWGELRRRRMDTPGMTAEEFAEKIARERQWTMLKGREMLYPAGYGYLGQFYGAGIMGGIYHYRAFFLIRDDVGYVLTCAAPPEKIADYLIPFEQILRSFQLK
ncbi:MAG: M48 family metalloprotease [Elusimicrobia bacterium]|nr:M48 family metalloprotease [Elusimicrobiota bacterium]